MVDYKKIVKKRETRLAIASFLSFVPDRIMISLIYRIKTGNSLNLKNPKRFTEKLQWIKLYYRNLKMIQCVDKYDVRNYVKEKGYEEILVNCYGIYSDYSEINFTELPDKFVIKDTLGSGGNSVIICTTRDTFDIDKAKNQIATWTSTNPRKKTGGREWPYYSGKKHRVLIEEYIESDSNKGGLIDYKFLCFNGKVEYVYGIADRKIGNGAGLAIYDRDFNLLPYLRADEREPKRVINKPNNYSDMISIAETLSEGFPHARIDLYNQNGKIQFGEITFFDGSGFMKFIPDEFDYIMGEKLDLQKVKHND